ncbi:hypothetical protein BX600DRAFT_48905 [Xylariales sp. PMI_506]|nr:hypothetical protein BX600DRAFT_48905 [Xylariales sp. PMI_506]
MGGESCSSGMGAGELFGDRSLVHCRPSASQVCHAIQISPLRVAGLVTCSSSALAAAANPWRAPIFWKLMHRFRASPEKEALECFTSFCCLRPPALYLITGAGLARVQAPLEPNPCWPITNPGALVQADAAVACFSNVITTRRSLRKIWWGSPKQELQLMSRGSWA